MKIEAYYEKLNKKSQEIFSAALEKPQLLSKVHSTASDLHKLSTCIANPEEAECRVWEKSSSIFRNSRISERN